MRPRIAGRPPSAVLCGVAVCMAVCGCGPAPTAAEGAPWEIWDDLHRLARLQPGEQVLLRGSRCPSGCRFDRHSAGDWRYIRVDGEEGVIFEEKGAGAITRIWMTMGQGVSQPLEPTVRLRLYIDAATEPVFDLPLPDLFNGSTPPFLPPLVGNRLSSSGGNFSYVPIPYRDGCRVTLVGAHEERIWYQFNFHRLDRRGDISSFTLDDDPSAWSALLEAAGRDPWPLVNDISNAVTTGGELTLTPGSSASLTRLTGPDSLTALVFRLPEAAWPEVRLELDFDGEPRVRLPLADFFAVGRGGRAGTRSLLLGVAEDGALYSYFPMPFFTSAEVSLSYPGSSLSPVEVAYEIRRANLPPAAASGLFGAQAKNDDETSIGSDIPLLALQGEGKWVGLFAELGSAGTSSRAYLEGDERVFLDGSLHPMVYGTGTEDIFNGGFYFDQGSFRRALHGSPYHFTENGEDVTAAYRLMPTDGIRFSHDLFAGLEGGPTGDLALRARTVAYYYLRFTPGLWRSDVLDLGDPASRAAHGYEVVGPHELRELDGFFEGMPAVAHRATGVYRPAGEVRFRLDAGPDAGRLRLRRRLDADLSGQEAEVYVGAELVGRFPPVDRNSDRRWREVDLDLATTAVESNGEIELRIVALQNLTAFRYELWSDSAGVLLFADGFESGDLSRWSMR